MLLNVWETAQNSSESIKLNSNTYTWSCLDLPTYHHLLCGRPGCRLKLQSVMAGTLGKDLSQLD